MSLARFIDPLTGDYVRAANGLWTLRDELDVQIVMSYSISLGSWEGDPTLGHRLAELDGALNNEDTRLRAQRLLLEPAQWLIDAGALDRVAVVVELAQRTGIAFEVSAFAAHESKPRVFDFFFPMGGS